MNVIFNNNCDNNDNNNNNDNVNNKNKGIKIIAKYIMK